MKSFSIVIFVTCLFIADGSKCFCEKTCTSPPEGYEFDKCERMACTCTVQCHYKEECGKGFRSVSAYLPKDQPCCTNHHERDCKKCHGKCQPNGSCRSGGGYSMSSSSHSSSYCES